MSRSVRIACKFQDMAMAFLAGLGFELQNDPGQFVTPYQSTKAVYKSQNGFYLLFGFDPYDGSYATVRCGRCWKYTSPNPEVRQFERVSNRYYVLARRFGFTLPRYYELHSNDETYADIQCILDDLRTTLPTVLERVTLDDLVAIESEQYGSQCAHEKYQDDYASRGVTFEGVTPFEQIRGCDDFRN